jgi:hypothetical protein
MVFNDTFDNSSVISWRIRTDNLCGDRDWLRRELLIQLPYDHDHGGHLFDFFVGQL